MLIHQFSNSNNNGLPPVPPSNYQPSGPQPEQPGKPSGGSDPFDEFDSARKLVTIAQILSLVSLIIGGVILSSAAIVISIIGYRRVKSLGAQHSAQHAKLVAMLNRTATIAIVMSVAALMLNIAALVFMMPVIMQVMQSGDYSSLFGGAASSPSSTGSSTWG